MEKTIISKCCREEAVKRIVGDEVAYERSGCNQPCEVEEVCAECLGTGKVGVTSKVYPGEPHVMNEDVDCPSCKKNKESHEHDDEQ